MTSKEGLAKTLLSFGRDSAADREFAIRENGELVAIVGPLHETLGRKMAAVLAMELALEAVSEWYRNGGPNVSDPPMDLVYAALGLADGG